MSFEIRQGDVLERLAEMPDESVDCVVTSPPYYGLRDYGTAQWIGGDTRCDHKQKSGSQGKTGQRADRTHTETVPYRSLCGKCGAERVDKQIGLEETPEQFIETLTAVFREVRRVLKPEGTLWVNIGDSYASRPGQRQQGVERNDVAGWKQQTNAGCLTIGSRAVPGCKPKDLIGIPWMLAFAPEAHFATFPLELPETCILAGAPPHGIVLDPFAGAGTTGLAALKQGRNFIGIELNPEYVKIAESRLAQRMPLFS